MDYSKLDLRKPENFEKTNKHERIILQGNECLNCIPDDIASRKEGFKIATESGIISISFDDLSTGTMLLGATGCGKTTLFNNILDKIIYTLSQEDVVIIFDSKRDYLNRYYDRRNPNHIVISVSEQDKSIAKSWNLFGELIDVNGKFGQDTEIIAQEISKAMFKGMESDAQPFFNLAAEDIFAKILSSMVRDAARSGDLKNLNNEYLYNFISSASNRSITDLTGKYVDYKYLGNYIGDGTSNQALGVYGYLMAMKNKNLSMFHRKNISGNFSIRRLVRERGSKVVFLEFDITYADTLSTMFSLFYDLAIKEALSLSTTGNTYFICDELNLLPYVSRFEELLNFGRSKGCKTLIGLQSVSQLQKNYGENEAMSILAGCLTAVCFNSVESASREYVKKRFGETFDVFNFGGSNLTASGYTITDSDIKNLRIGEAFIDMKGQPPFKVKFTKGL